MLSKILLQVISDIIFIYPQYALHSTSSILTVIFNVYTILKYKQNMNICNTLKCKLVDHISINNTFHCMESA